MFFFFLLCAFAPAAALREALRKNIHDHKQHDDNGNEFDGGFYGMRIKNLEHWIWCFVSGCKGEIAAITTICDLDRKPFFVGEVY